MTGNFQFRRCMVFAIAVIQFRIRMRNGIPESKRAEMLIIVFLVVLFFVVLFFIQLIFPLIPLIIIDCGDRRYRIHYPNIHTGR